MAIDYNKYNMSKEEKIKFILVLFVGLLFVGILFYESYLIPLVLPFIYKGAKGVYETYMGKRRKSKLAVQFKDFLYSLASSFASGRHMSEGLMEAKNSLTDVYDDSDYIMIEIDGMNEKIRKTGESDIDVLQDFALRSHMEDIENFTQIFRACRETGGDFVTSMNKSAAIIGEKITIENEIRTMISQKKVEGRIITLMPIAIILFLKIMSPEYLDIMYQTIAGRIMMSASLGATVLAYLWIERITDIEV